MDQALGTAHPLRLLKITEARRAFLHGFSRGRSTIYSASAAIAIGSVPTALHAWNVCVFFFPYSSLFSSLARNSPTSADPGEGIGEFDGNGFVDPICTRTSAGGLRICSQPGLIIRRPPNTFFPFCFSAGNNLDSALPSFNLAAEVYVPVRPFSDSIPGVAAQQRAGHLQKQYYMHAFAFNVLLCLY